MALPVSLVNMTGYVKNDEECSICLGHEYENLNMARNQYRRSDLPDKTFVGHLNRDQADRIDHLIHLGCLLSSPPHNQRNPNCPTCRTPTNIRNIKSFAHVLSRHPIQRVFGESINERPRPSGLRVLVENCAQQIEDIPYLFNRHEAGIHLALASFLTVAVLGIVFNIEKTSRPELEQTGPTVCQKITSAIARFFMLIQDFFARIIDSVTFSRPIEVPHCN